MKENLGAGYGWQALAQAKWLNQCEIYYWGNLDTHGFAILDRLRRLLKTTKTKKQKEYGIWREKTGLNGRELLKTGALRCIAPFLFLGKEN